MITLYTLVSVLLVSLVSFVGVVTLIFKQDLLRKSIFILVSIAVGALLGDVFIHIIPEAFTGVHDPRLVSFLIIGGVLFFFVLEKILHWHHHAIEHTEACEHPIGKMVIFGDGVHNFIDGLIIASSYMISVEVGIATTVAVILHEIPQEIGNFGVLIHSGYKTSRALWFNFLSALTAVGGAACALFLGNLTEQFATLLLPITAGGFIYIALSDLIPELQKDTRFIHGVIQAFSILVGVTSMAVLSLFE